MRQSRWLVAGAWSLTLAWLGLAGVEAAVKVVPGQEFVYSGTAQWQFSSASGRTMTIGGPIRFSALVTESNPSRGYTVVVMRSSQPQKKPGQPGFAPEASV